MDCFSAFEVKSLDVGSGSNERGVFVARVAVFGNVDSVGDRVVKGAFDRTLEEDGLPPIVWSHQWLTPPVGATLKAEQSDDGLDIKGQLFVGDVQLADHIYAAMSRVGGDGKAALRQFSFGYDVRGYSVVESSDPNAWDGQVRELTDLKLYEVGPCLRGANASTELLAVKGVQPVDGTPDHFARSRREGGSAGKTSPARMSRAARDAHLAALLERR